MKLYQHQMDGLQKCKELNHVAFYWDMGLGKTFAGSEKMYELGAKLNFVVCQKSKIEDWCEHFKEHYDCGIYNLTDPKEMEAFWHVLGDIHFEKSIIGIINYDLIWRRKDLLMLKNFTLLLDESSLIQNETAKRSKFILQMQPANVILLSGTPTGGKYEKLWSQMHLLGWNISKGMYWNQFVNVTYLDTVQGRSIPLVTGYKNVDRLKRKMAQYGCQFLKTDEVFDLPSQTFQKIKVPASNEYKQFRKNRVVTAQGRELIGDTTLTKMLYERMLCGQFSAEKLKAFSDLVESTEDRLVVFYNFTEELDALMQIANAHQRPFGVVNGQHKNPEVLAAKGAILFVQYQAGAMGLNLQSSNKIIYYSLPLSSELYEQSKKRIHRIGQERPCFYYILMCKGSIEEKILATLEMRKDYPEKLFEKDDW